MLLKAVPPIQENFNILSKVGEGLLPWQSLSFGWFDDNKLCL